VSEIYVYLVEDGNMGDFYVADGGKSHHGHGGEVV
jgi:hypothetical protein